MSEKTYNLKKNKLGKILHQLLALMSFQARKTYAYLQDTNKDIFIEIWEIFVPTLKVHSPKALTVQNVHDEIVE